MIARLYARGLLVQGIWPPLPADGQAHQEHTGAHGGRTTAREHPVGSAGAAGPTGPAGPVSPVGPVGPVGIDWPHYKNEVPVEMSFDALQALREGGHPVDLLAGEQRTVLAELSELEVQVLNSVRVRLEAAAAEVEGQDLKLL
ncbi:hypothetical protein OG552_19055 [Streptomyces sp. NBC_01476]|uniref:aroma-sacti cluster domain-containing protein n=1 Tax=Streptomyces sp. NBC_01476 TaxID=2903881 RepID=UPI002E32F745|nr:aroma-sacti cluster domain-containing protein [Streptomyces sp. NBC_01476]